MREKREAGKTVQEGLETNPNKDMPDDCSFCQEVEGGETVSLSFVREFFAAFGRESRILLQTEKFFLVPSLGGLTVGHVLLLPKAHYYSVGEIPGTEIAEFEYLTGKARRVLLDVFGMCSAFEHGCVERTGKAGACIDHAHLHLLPLSQNLGPDIESRFGTGVSVRSLSDLRQFSQRGIPYLYYENSNGIARAYEAPVVPSQFFRQLVLAKSSNAGNWDWKRDLRIRTVTETFDTLKGPFAEVETEIATERIESRIA